MRAMLQRPRAQVFLAVALVFTVALVTRSVMAANPERPARWEKVLDAESKGLPQTAIKELEPIIASAMADKAYPEAIKAIAKKIALEGTIQGNKPEERIVRLQAEITKAPKEMVSVMEAILANWYWHYYQQNSWRFLQRTATGQQPGDDFTTWDLSRLFAEIDKRFEAALAAEAELKATPVAAYDDLLEKGTVPDNYRPTLYDFLAHEALRFYRTPGQVGARPADAFDPDADSPILGTLDEFLAWNPRTTDTASHKLKAIRLYQKLLNFHKDDAEPTARLDLDLDRLEFAHNVAVGVRKDDRYKAALERFIEQNPRHELSATAGYFLASLLVEQKRMVEAKKVAEAAIKAFPKSHGGLQCQNLISGRIEAPELQLITERVWAEPFPAIRVSYRNVTKVYFRAYRANWEQRLSKAQWRPEQLTDDERKAYLRGKPSYEWSADLPATEDYLTRTEDLPAKGDMKPGFYFLFASPDPKFLEETKPLFGTDIWVSNLALVVRNRLEGFGLDGFVLYAKTGEPIAGAKVREWTRNNQGKFVGGGAVETDQNGRFTVIGERPNGAVLLASHGGQELASGIDHHPWYGHHRPSIGEHTVFFTDRSIYRPGQSIQFKGICVHHDQDKNDYKALPNRSLNVRLLDPNGQEASQLQVKTNDYGSFSGSFTAPRDRLTGRMTIQVESGPFGATSISVEEYKRPKFQVEVEAPKEPAKLNAIVTVTGKATAYTGAAVGGAQVKYRVTREVRYPEWWYGFYWWRVPQQQPAQEIAQGNTTTATDGSFAITFPATADPTVPESDNPKFNFAVTADVTDGTGETRTGTRTATVGYTDLDATIAAADWQAAGEPVKLTVKTTTLDGRGKKAKGTVTVYGLKQPERPIRPDVLDGGDIPFPIPRPRRVGRIAPIQPADPTPDPSDPRNWDLAEAVATLPLETDADGKAEMTAELPVGPFRAVLATADEFGKPVTGKAQIMVFDPRAEKLTVKVPNLFAAPKWSLEPGEEFTAIWGTGYDSGRAFVEVEHRGQVLQSYWTDPGRTQARITQKVDETMRGGVTVRVTAVRENRSFVEERIVNVPWTNKDLTVKWERFVSKLEPGRKETFTVVISGPNAQRAVAEMVATLYDASLDAYMPHEWQRGFGVFRQERNYRTVAFENRPHQLNHIYGWWPSISHSVPSITYRQFPADVTQNLWDYKFARRGLRLGAGVSAPEFHDYRIPAPLQSAAPMMAAEGVAGDAFGGQAEMAKAATPAGPPLAGVATPPRGPDLGQVSARTNLNETAFFLPHLTTDDQGTVRMEFTMPEALTKWKFMGFAHDKELRSGFLSGEVVTAKDLMVEPNPPRFLREGDVLEFAVKVTNQSATRLTGTVRLSLTDARTGEPIDAAMGLTAPDLTFEVPSKESRPYFWRLTVPDGQGPVIYKVVGASDRLSDGEEGILPVLSKRVLVTESLPLPVRGQQTKQFTLAKLIESKNSDTIRSQALTVQATSNPAWYAVLALPYLMEYPYECSEQTFNRMYANALARHIATSDPKIRRVFDQWRNMPALDSPLEKNQDLKAVLLAETPWVRQAKSESEARRNVGILFDDTRLANETARALSKLAELQRNDGRWAWFPGGPPNDYITLYITTGFGRLRHLGVKTVDPTPALRAAATLDAFADQLYRDALKHHKDKKDENHLSPTVALYLYGRSFFLNDVPIANQHREAVNYWLGQAKKHWLKLANPQSQAHLAIGLKRFGDQETPKAILASLRERAVNDDELGMFWRVTEASFFWYRAPIETQAMMIEAFDEVANDPKAVEDCKVWLLKQKQTRDWKTTKATADAVYGLLLRGDNLLKSDALLQVSLGGEPVKPEAVEAGTGFFEQTFVRSEVRPDMGHVTVTKTDPGVAWGAVHWQYLEDVSKVTPHTDTPLKLEKKLFVRKYEKAGPTLYPVAGPVQVGDEVVVRVVLRTDRDMEYVHLKDHRGSGTEPVNVLSRYKYQDGLGYYESTRDTSTDFFIDYLPKGTYVFEYPVRVQHRGRYPTGLASVQCMYAPEFNSHSESIVLDAR